MSNLKWGSPEWETHMRRSLAQRKRHGQITVDIEKLIGYIKDKGPVAKDITHIPNDASVKFEKPTRKIVRGTGRQIVQVGAPLTKIVPNENGLFNAPLVLGGR